MSNYAADVDFLLSLVMPVLFSHNHLLFNPFLFPLSRVS